MSSTLHIGVDGRELLGEATGVGRYLDRVLQCWMRAPDWPHRVTVFLHGDPPARFAGEKRLAWHIERAPRGGTLWEQTRLPRALRRANVDVLFAVGYTAPLRAVCPFVVVVHDVSYFTHPEWFGRREGARRRFFTTHTVRRAHTVLTVSQFSAAEITSVLGTPAKRIRLAPPGAPPAAPLSPIARPPLVLFVGAILNRRNVPALIAAFSDVSRQVPDARLVLVGPNRSLPVIDPRALAAEAGIATTVDWREYVTDDELAGLYRSARVFAFLSEYEGFAMTPMEALAEGVPPVLLDTPVAREVYGDAALRVPLERAAIADALTSLLTDEPIRGRVLAAREALFHRFSWARTADVVRRALEDAAAGR